ncbi:Protein of unknown function [Noviherbaspirillum humi]|uniref:DUF2938 domain-containing protein n=1 Tax=Noviherbaspirillum humi TaxID=1688639 RepID=A0A239LLM9_9BURK|nr:DUF2938 domain-containing protein [Noviherbaspirillum humi]SNT31200.1 Protein of unknown function [Noviherbaspirillum humi]
MTATEAFVRIILLGTGATAVMDAWLLLLKRMGVQTLNFAFIGRWVGHCFRGTLVHPSIGKALPIPGERVLGWLGHYAIGIAFAGLLVGLEGTAWMRAPSLLPAVAVGLGTVAVPLLAMQPAMGMGIAASRTPTPFRNCMRSVVNHAVFGLGLYLASAAVEWFIR